MPWELLLYFSILKLGKEKRKLKLGWGFQMNIPIDKFENYLRNKNLKERTIENYIYYFNKFTYDLFNQETISRFMSDKTNRNSIGRSFLVNFQKFLKVNYKELGLSEKVRIDISEVELPRLSGRTKQRLIKPIPHEQIDTLEEFFEEEELKLQLLLNYYGLLRLEELIRIRIMSFGWDQWKKDTSKIGECVVLGKGDKEGIAFIPSFLMVRIARFIRNNNFNSVNSKLFTNGERSWQIKLRDAGIKTGITKLDEKENPIQETIIHPHRLRHSYASYLINIKKMDIRKVQIMLRHSSITSTQIYTHIDNEGLKEELEEFN